MITFASEDALLAEVELLATEQIMVPPRFLFQTPDHHEPRAYRVGEVYVGLRGQTRIKLVDGVGRVAHWDRDEVSCVGLVRNAHPY